MGLERARTSQGSESERPAFPQRIPQDPESRSRRGGTSGAARGDPRAPSWTAPARPAASSPSSRSKIRRRGRSRGPPAGTAAAPRTRARDARPLARDAQGGSTARRPARLPCTRRRRRAPSRGRRSARPAPPPAARAPPMPAPAPAPPRAAAAASRRRRRRAARPRRVARPRRAAARTTTHCPTRSSSSCSCARPSTCRARRESPTGCTSHWAWWAFPTAKADSPSPSPRHASRAGPASARARAARVALRPEEVARLTPSAAARAALDDHGRADFFSQFWPNVTRSRVATGCLRDAAAAYGNRGVPRAGARPRLPGCGTAPQQRTRSCVTQLSRSRHRSFRPSGCLQLCGTSSVPLPACAMGNCDDMYGPQSTPPTCSKKSRAG